MGPEEMMEACKGGGVRRDAVRRVEKAFDRKQEQLDRLKDQAMTRLSQIQPEAGYYDLLKEQLQGKCLIASGNATEGLTLLKTNMKKLQVLVDSQNIIIKK